MSAIIVKKAVLHPDVSFSATLAGAALLLNDTFTYPDGPLVAVSGGVWAHHSGSASGSDGLIGPGVSE